MKNYGLGRKINLNNKAYPFRVCLLILLVYICTLISGCGSEEEAGDIQTAAENIPSIEEFDTGMSQAHFISAPKDFYAISDIAEELKSVGKAAPLCDEYSVSYFLKLSDAESCFLLSDGTGEYGQSIVCRIISHPNYEIENESLVSIEICELNKGAMKTPIGSSEAVSISSDYDAFNVELFVQDNLISARVLTADNTAESNEVVSLQNIAIPKMQLGAIGTYRFRGDNKSYIDDIEVVDSEQNILWKESFESADQNIFSPYYIRLSDGAMEVDYGVTLTRLEGAPAFTFHKEFEIENVSDIEQAYLFMAALGSFDANINEKPVSNHFLDPGRVYYDERLEYVSFDIKDMLQDKNKMDITLLHGFFDRGLGYPEVYSSFGSTLALKGEIVIVYADGSKDIIPTDDSFLVCKNGIIRNDDVYQGQIIDLRFEDEEPLYVNAESDKVDEKFLNLPLKHKSVESMETVLEMKPLTVSSPEKGVFVYDFGQNFAGNLALSIKGDFIKAYGKVSEGDYSPEAIVFRYGELLNEANFLNSDGAEGTVYTDNLLTAKATDYLIYQTEDIEADRTYEIAFSETYHGFRYLEITGISEAIPIENITAHVISNAMEQTGTFSSSNAALNKYYENSKFSILSNFLDTPTDCAQRDERLGWAGDAYDSSGFASYLLNTNRFYSKFIEDMNLRQAENGAYYDISTQNIGDVGRNCWGDAPIAIAYSLYLQYGNKDILQNNYENFKKWVDYLINDSTQYIRFHDSYGDHLSLQSISAELSDTAWCAHSADLLSKIAGILGKKEDEAYYSKEFQNYKNAWQQRYIREDGSVVGGILNEESETAYALGICFGLFDEEMMQDAADRLNILVEWSGFKFCPGYSGLTFLLPALGRYGYSETAMRILESIEEGSLLYTVGIGMTTIPEALDSIKYYEDGTYSLTGSLNHHAYAGICGYFYTDLLGIQPDVNAPGYKHFYLRPLVNSGLDTVEGSYRTDYGVITVKWDSTNFNCTVPEGTTCTLVLPNSDEMELIPGEYSYSLN